MSTGCALYENWVNIVVKNSPLFCLGTVKKKNAQYYTWPISQHNITDSHRKRLIISSDKLMQQVVEMTKIT